ncbi:MAG: AIR synthase-related protein, partial [Flavitalea sp.]
VYPTPTIGMVGLLEDVNDKMTMSFKETGDIIFLVGKSSGDINSSEYLQKIKGVEFSPVPQFDLDTEYALQQKVAELISNKLIESAHDISEGGLFITLIESSFKNNLGFDVVASDPNIRKDGFWFGESQSRVVVTVSKKNVKAFKTLAGIHPFEELGEVTTGSVEVDGQNWGFIGEWKNTYNTAIEKLLGVNANN